MQRILISVAVVLAVVVTVSVSSAQQRPPNAPPAATTPADEIKLEESSSLRAAAIQSRMSAILANLALIQRQFQDLQTEWTKQLDERKKLLEAGATKSRVELRDPNEWVYDESGHRYVRMKKP